MTLTCLCLTEHADALQHLLYPSNTYYTVTSGYLTQLNSSVWKDLNTSVWKGLSNKEQSVLHVSKACPHPSMIVCEWKQKSVLPSLPAITCGTVMKLQPKENEQICNLQVITVVIVRFPKHRWKAAGSLELSMLACSRGSWLQYQPLSLRQTRNQLLLFLGGYCISMTVLTMPNRDRHWDSLSHLGNMPTHQGETQLKTMKRCSKQFVYSSVLYHQCWPYE